MEVREEGGGGGVRAEVVRAAVRGAPRDVVNLRFAAIQTGVVLASPRITSQRERQGGRRRPAHSPPSRCCLKRRECMSS